MKQEKINEIMQKLRVAVGEIALGENLWIEEAEVTCSADLKDQSATFTLTVTVEEDD